MLQRRPQARPRPQETTAPKASRQAHSKPDDERPIDERRGSNRDDNYEPSPLPQNQNDSGGVASSANYISRVGVWYQFVDVITSVAQSESDVIPKEFRLDQNYPNPFNPATTIQFALPRESQVKLKLFDILGREVTTLVDEELEPGEYKVVFEAKGLTSGVYFYRIIIEGFVRTKKLTLLK